MKQAPATARSALKSARVPSLHSRAVRQRERILDAAEMCFIQSGFHGASMAHIATTAGMSPGLIYRYFDSKSAIVKAIIERHLESEHYKKIGQLHSAEDVSRSKRRPSRHHMRMEGQECLIFCRAFRCGR